jgi:hypothetical protein
MKINYLGPASDNAKEMKCGYEVTGMILLQVYLYTSSLLRGITFKVLPFNSCACSPMMLSLLETFLEFLLWNSF